ncbi:MAG: cysteate synthase [Alistipes sp.]|nr:cysteate synthase [Alistipes sp.]
MKGFQPTRYYLENVLTGTQFPDRGWMLDDPGCSDPALVRAVYSAKQIEVKDESLGLYKFSDWLPVSRALKGSASPVTYHSKGLGGYLGLKNLYITFSGWFPEIGASMTTCSFKETEAYSVCGRMEADERRVLVVASAGNTARAFAKVCSENNIPLLISVPRDNINALWFEKPLNDCVKLICPEAGGDYFDAIHLSNLVLMSDRYVAEGGCKNIARRDGMGTTVLSAVTFLGMIPDYYFQAVGSGTGAIAAWEANLRFLADGRYGDTKMKLIVSQNAPFLPIYDAWKAGSRAMLPYSDEQARKDAEAIDAKVLSNRKPPYGIAGGLFDALTETGGDVDAVSNDRLREAARIFAETEGIDIHPAAATATASLIERVLSGSVEPDKTIMLNITGGGEERFKADFTEQTGRELFYLQPEHVFPLGATSCEVLEVVDKLFF